MEEKLVKKRIDWKAASRCECLARQTGLSSNGHSHRDALHCNFMWYANASVFKHWPPPPEEAIVQEKYPRLGCTERRIFNLEEKCSYDLKSMST